MSKQSIKNGSIVTFNSNGFTAEEMDMDEVFLMEYNGQRATVTSLETYTELGEQDYEYYNIKFHDEQVLCGISGFHLTVQ